MLKYVESVAYLAQRFVESLLVIIHAGNWTIVLIKSDMVMVYKCV